MMTREDLAPLKGAALDMRATLARRLAHPAFPADRKPKLQAIIASYDTLIQELSTW